MLDILKKINRLLYEPLTWDPIDRKQNILQSNIQKMNVGYK